MNTVINGSANDRMGITRSTPQPFTGVEARCLPANGEQGIVAYLERGYNWFSQSNQNNAQQHLRGVCLAKQHELQRQQWLHIQAVYKLVTKDVADRVAQLVAQHCNYRSPLYYHPDHLALPDRSFENPEKIQEGYVSYVWVYQPIQTFAQIIPLHALEAMELLTQNSLTPLAYWVADKLKVQPTRRVSVDPLLCAQYGRWFVGLAHWI